MWISASMQFTSRREQTNWTKSYLVLIIYLLRRRTKESGVVKNNRESKMRGDAKTGDDEK
jgi:hypothetical protein